MPMTFLIMTVKRKISTSSSRSCLRKSRRTLSQSKRKKSLVLEEEKGRELEDKLDKLTQLDISSQM
jgi:hypothetical protein